MHGMMNDMIGDLVWSAKPVEIKIFSTDVNFLKDTAPAIQAQIDGIPHVVDTQSGLVIAGPALDVPRALRRCAAFRPDRLRHRRGR